MLMQYIYTALLIKMTLKREEKYCLKSTLIFYTVKPAFKAKHIIHYLDTIFSKTRTRLEISNKRHW